MLAISTVISNTDLKSALIPFVTAGYPNLNITAEVVQLLDCHGVQAIELGVPYSDALADGLVIQESSRVALEQETYLDQVMGCANMLNKKIKAPIIIFTYLNPILSKGAEVFVREIARTGVKGLVIPDLPLEETEYFIALCTYYNIELILFVAPSSSSRRVRKIVQKAPGCIYLVSSYGVTGAKDDVDTSVYSIVDLIRSISDKPIILGFGISNDLQVTKIMKSNLDISAIVIGTAFINQIKNSYNDRGYNSLSLFCYKLMNAMSFA